MILHGVSNFKCRNHINKNFLVPLKKWPHTKLSVSQNTVITCRRWQCVYFLIITILYPGPHSYFGTLQQSEDWSRNSAVTYTFLTRNYFFFQQPLCVSVIIETIWTTLTVVETDRRPHALVESYNMTCGCDILWYYSMALGTSCGKG
jgi:hypothetical protein